MGNLSPKEVIEVVKEQSGKFQAMNLANLDFEQECLFARQQILKSDFTLKIAANNPKSLQAAILNVAAIGISLNPASQHAYLVPRDNQICLDISYRGFVRLATESGSIKWAKVELVYENDKFTWKGPAEPPEHDANPFQDRGDIIGGYCIAKLPDEDILTEVMPIDEINKIRGTSKAFKKGGGPWVDWYEEMAKKTIIKRAYKSWPQTPNRERTDKAMEVLHETEGMAYTIEQHTEFMEAFQKEDALKFYILYQTTEDTAWLALFNSFPKGEKTKMKDKARELEKLGVQQFTLFKDGLVTAALEEDEVKAKELMAELDDIERDFIFKHLPSGTVEYVEKAA